jgi:phosphatidylglycerophosphatase A
MKKAFIKCVATFFYAGYLPKAPGTWGSIAALPLVCLIGNTGVYMGVLIVILLVGCWAAGAMAETVGSKDPKQVVVDEVAGMMITMLLIPITGSSVLLGFVFFRLFDITKPWLVRKAERFPKGYGIMLDDVVAGIFANVMLRCILMGVQGA